jgi:hypothetical protein
MKIPSQLADFALCVEKSARSQAGQKWQTLKNAQRCLMQQESATAADGRALPRVLVIKRSFCICNLSSGTILDGP